MRRLFFSGILGLAVCAQTIGAVKPSPSDIQSALYKLSDGFAVGVWRYTASDVRGAQAVDFNDSSWRVDKPGLQWGKQKVAWMRATIVTPDKIGGVPITGSQLLFRASLNDFGEVYVNGKLKQKFHWDHCSVILADKAVPGEKFQIAIRGTNNFENGTLVSAFLTAKSVGDMQIEAKNYLVDQAYSQSLVDKEKDVKKKASGQASIDSAISAINAASIGKGDIGAFDSSIAKARKHLGEIAGYLKAYNIYFIGHSHIDMNWQWLWPETLDVCNRTFSTVVKLMDEYPQFRYSQSGAAAYRAMEQHYPKLFEDIKRKVKSGQWEIVAATWVEGDQNMASGESIVRQVMTAQEYTQDKFGVTPVIGWEPDTFGHPWTMPQILARSGLKYYYFMRCRKKEQAFWWQSPDGSKVLAYTYGSYDGPISQDAQDAAFGVAKLDGVKDGMILYGVGDHGGAVTRADIEKGLQLQKLTNYPTVKFSSAEAYYADLLSKKKDWPVIDDELNTTLEGCYTSHGDIKKMNRELENLLPTAETFSTLALPYGFKYPQNAFTEAWRNTCFNQFHDILCGTAIHGSYEYSRGLYNTAHTTGRTALSGSTALLAKQVDTRGNGIPVVVFNPLSWDRTDVVRAAIPAEMQGGSITVRDASGSTMPSSRETGDVVFTAKNVPSIGYKVFYLTLAPAPPKADQGGDKNMIENQYYTVQIDPTTGTISSIFDKSAKREVVAPGQKANLLQIIFERPHGGSAWVIRPNGKEQDLISPETVKLISKTIDSGVIRVTYRFDKSFLSEDIILNPGVPRIDFRLSADWDENGNEIKAFPMLKVAFPVDVLGGKARFEIPFGSIERPTSGDEVPAQKWIDYSNSNYGVSLLNDCKYGHDVSGNVMRLTLLRASYDPDPTADKGHHEIGYSLYPHMGDWRKASTVRRGYEFNNPLIPVIADNHAGKLPEEYSFVKVEPSNLVVTAFKKAQRNDDLVLRFYESSGSAGNASIKLGINARSACETNLMEVSLGKPSIPMNGGKLTVPIGKWEIKTLRIKSGK